MTIFARLVAVSSFCIALVATPAGAADRERPTITAQASLASAAAASADSAAPNCLLPGQIHKFGGITTVTPRRAVTLDAADCAARGGEPIESTTAAVE
jgi:hypothetical protein